MRSCFRTTQFRRDLRLAAKRGYSLKEISDIVGLLLDGKTLPEKNRDHGLPSWGAGVRDCHIKPDWILIYRIDGNELILIRTGTHADLFD